MVECVGLLFKKEDSRFFFFFLRLHENFSFFVLRAILENQRIYLLKRESKFILFILDSVFQVKAEEGFPVPFSF